MFDFILLKLKEFYIFEISIGFFILYFFYRNQSSKLLKNNKNQLKNNDNDINNEKDLKFKSCKNPNCIRCKFVVLQK